MKTCLFHNWILCEEISKFYSYAYCYKCGKVMYAPDVTDMSGSLIVTQKMCD
jgi:hypothetical protein